MKQLYVCSKPIIDKNGDTKRHLLGILSFDNEKGYSFEYKLGDTNDSQLLISVFPDKNKIYENMDARLLLDDYLPSENDTAYIKDILKKSGLSEYNEWDWLRTFESADDDAETKLYETLPDDIIIHEDIKKCEQNSEIDETYDESETDVDMDDNNDFYDEFDELISVDNEITNNNFFKIKNVDSEDELVDINIYDLFDEELETTPIDNLETTVNELINEKKSKKIQEVTIVTKEIKRTIKKSDEIDGFIIPPPNEPFDIIEQRLADSIKKRQEKLQKQSIE